MAKIFWAEKGGPRSARSDSGSDEFGQQADGLFQFTVSFIRVGVLAKLAIALHHITFQDQAGYRFQGGLGRPHLGENRFAILVVVHHALEAPDLAFDFPQPGQDISASLLLRRQEGTWLAKLSPGNDYLRCILTLPD
jgi:hypothetical protein